jgi:hypothetical protein
LHNRTETAMIHARADSVGALAMKQNPLRFLLPAAIALGPVVLVLGGCRSGGSGNNSGSVWTPNGAGGFNGPGYRYCLPNGAGGLNCN